MRLYYFSLFAVIANMACAGGAIAGNVNIDNALVDCIELKPVGVETAGPLSFLKTEWVVNNNIGACGCKSAAMHYDVVMPDNGQILTHGIINSMNKSSYKFLINTDNSVFGKNGYVLRVSCSNPG